MSNSTLVEATARAIADRLVYDIGASWERYAAVGDDEHRDHDAHNEALARFIATAYTAALAAADARGSAPQAADRDVFGNVVYDTCLTCGVMNPCSIHGQPPSPSPAFPRGRVAQEAEHSKALAHARMIADGEAKRANETLERLRVAEAALLTAASRGRAAGLREAADRVGELSMSIYGPYPSEVFRTWLRTLAAEADHSIVDTPHPSQGD